MEAAVISAVLLVVALISSVVALVARPRPKSDSPFHAAPPQPLADPTLGPYLGDDPPDWEHDPPA
jgi:hypothetical protein